MKFVYTTGRVPIKSWATNLEPNALEQAKNIANLPFVFKHVSVMADGHMGYGAPIGTVAALEGVVSPAIVGVDIGCGVYAVKTSVHSEELSDISILKQIMSEIRRRIPVGFSRRAKGQHELHPIPKFFDAKSLEVVLRESENAVKSLGTLGGGNHFIEIQKDAEGNVWFMIHSGSRNLGKQVADHHTKIAQKLNQRYHSAVPKDWNLAFLPSDSEEGRSYIADMRYCVSYALENRRIMGDDIKSAFTSTLGEDVSFEKPINIAHNYAALEHHFGRNLLVHRKGATRMRVGDIGLVPGSQGTASYVVSGKGEKNSFNSCSHGAGRIMGRREAVRKLALEDEIRRLDSCGIVHSIRSAKDLDEAPGAYKDIDQVMDNQFDLVEIVTKLVPLGVIKG